MEPLPPYVREAVMRASCAPLPEDQMHEVAADYLAHYLRLWLEKYGKPDGEMVSVPRGLMEWFLAYDKMQREQKTK